MRPLIDGDILLYEIGACGQYVEEGEEKLRIRDFSFVKELMDNRIEEICRKVEATEEPRIFLTGAGNFRIEAAKRKGYKANRDGVERPYHYKNLKGYLMAVYDTVLVEGYEADDAMAMEQVKEAVQIEPPLTPTIICTRDKDLRMVPGWHYGWECGDQPEYGPRFIDKVGYIEPRYFPEGHKREGKLKEIKGGGLLWFYAQMLLGDPVDNIPGLPKIGPVKALKILQEHGEDLKGLFSAVKEQYVNLYGPDWRREMEEQGQLLWMIRDRDEQGNLTMWSIEYADSLNR